MITSPKIPPKYLHPLTLNGMNGRYVLLPAVKKRQQPILLIYGHHSSLERMFSIARAFNEFGEIAMPDLPGFGGMEPLQKSDKKPTIDNLADFLADFVRQQYPKGKKFRLVAMSLGFVIAVRMLQRHPDIAKQVTNLTSLVGFVHYDDFAFEPSKQKMFAKSAKLFAQTAPAKIFGGLFLRKPFISSVYHLRAKTHPKMKGYSYKQRKALIDFEVHLWQCNEVQTYFSTMHEMLTIDLTHTPLELPVHHVAVASDQYFDNEAVAANMAKMFSDVTVHNAHMPNHAPTVIEDVRSARQLIPESLAEVLDATL